MRDSWLIWKRIGGVYGAMLILMGVNDTSCRPRSGVRGLEVERGGTIFEDEARWGGGGRDGIAYDMKVIC